MTQMTLHRHYALPNIAFIMGSLRLQQSPLIKITSKNT